MHTKAVNGRDSASLGSPSLAASDSERPVVLDVKNLTVRFSRGGTPVRAVNGVSFALREGERLGIVGESGSGKSVTALALLGLLNGADIDGEAIYGGRNLVCADERELQKVRGAEIAYIFQDPLSALDPGKKIGDQVAEPLRLRGTGRSQARARSLELLKRVGIRDAERRIDDYPHQLSGGMRQRVVIAMALIAEPKILIADEPTTALDVRIQAQVLDLLFELVEERNLAVILTTHDLGVLAGFADRVMVMYAGRCVEECVTDDLFYSSLHPYTHGLIGAVPRIEGELAQHLRAIPGYPPSPANLPSGCAFHPRCPHATDLCREVVPPLEVFPSTSGEHTTACIRAEEIFVRPGGDR